MSNHTTHNNNIYTETSGRSLNLAGEYVTKPVPEKTSCAASERVA